jgi:myosin-crossreactive antigen
VVPAGSQNFAFLGQFVEIPHGIVFTTEYSVLGAIHAVKKFVKPSLVVPPMYFGQYHPLTCAAVASAMARYVKSVRKLNEVEIDHPTRFKDKLNKYTSTC